MHLFLPQNMVHSHVQSFKDKQFILKGVVESCFTVLDFLCVRKRRGGLYGGPWNLVLDDLNEKVTVFLLQEKEMSLEEMVRLKCKSVTTGLSTQYMPINKR